MPQTATIATVITTRGESIRGEESFSAGSQLSIDEPIAPSASASILLPIDVSALKVLFVTADQPVSIEFEGPAISKSLAAHAVFSWTLGSSPNPFDTTDVTGLSVLNESEEATANLRVEVLVDPTP